jgi:predicted nucleotidyltransferase
MQHTQLLEVFRQRLLDALPTYIRHIIVFGSQARGEATPASDVDVLVIVRDSSPWVTERIRQIRYEVMEEYHFVPLLSLVILDEADSEELRSRGSGLLRNIEREGVTLWTR